MSGNNAALFYRYCMILENSLLQQIPNEMLTQLVVDEGYCIGYMHHYFWIFPRETHDILKLGFHEYCSYLRSSLEHVMRYIVGAELNAIHFLVLDQKVTKEELIEIATPILKEFLDVFAGNTIYAVMYSVDIAHERLPEHYEKRIKENATPTYWIKYCTYFGLELN